jgi:hypothetical protein
MSFHQVAPRQAIRKASELPDGVLVAEVTSDTPRKVSCSRLKALIQNTKALNRERVKAPSSSIIQNAHSTKLMRSNTLLNCS